MEESEIIADLSILEFYLHRLINLRLNPSDNEDDLASERRTIINLTTLIDGTLKIIILMLIGSHYKDAG